MKKEPYCFWKIFTREFVARLSRQNVEREKKTKNTGNVQPNYNNNRKAEKRVARVEMDSEETI